MSLQEINQMHVDQQTALFNMITKNDIKFDEMKEEDAVADFNEKYKKGNI